VEYNRPSPSSRFGSAYQAGLLVFCAPARFDRFVLAVSEPAQAEELPPRGRPFDPEQFAVTAAEHGIELLGPPGALPED
jgi:hypothetical protein